jgi:hypothetical protein
MVILTGSLLQRVFSEVPNLDLAVGEADKICSDYVAMSNQDLTLRNVVSAKI